MMLSSHPKNGYSFGFKWSLVGCALALVYISACELIVPPDRSVSRYNTVIGEKRRPELNPGGTNYEGDNSQKSRAAAMNSAYYGDAAPVQPTSAAPVAPLPEAPVEESSSARHRPSENAAASMTVAAASVSSNDLAPLPGAYPDLHATPEKPTAAAVDNTKQRSIAIRGEMEYEQQNAAAARDQALKDATAEPSLLANPSSLPNLPPPPPMTKSQSVQVEQMKAQSVPSSVNGSAFERLTNQPNSSAQEPIRLTPPAPTIVPPPAPLTTVPANAPFASVNVKPAPEVAGVASPNPQASSALEPIHLVPPGAQMASVPAENATAMAGTQTAALQPPVTTQRYINNQAYLPSSRYAARRQ